MPAPFVITGGAGFIGAHLVRNLLAAGQRVLVLDDLSAPSSLGLPDDPRLQLSVGDVRDRALVDRVLSGARCVLHLASVVGVDAVTADPERTGSVIREGTAAVLARCRREGARLIFFSTSEVTDPPRSGPRAVYGAAKRDAERLLLAAADQVELTIVRPFNIVGPGQSSPGMVLPALAGALRRGEPLPIHGDGRQTRSFLHVHDLVDAVMALLARGRTPSGEIVEIGSERRVSIAELGGRLAALAGVRVERGAGPRAPQDGRREDRPRRAPDLGSLRRLVPFAPRRDLETILREALGSA